MYCFLCANSQYILRVRREASLWIASSVEMMRLMSGWRNVDCRDSTAVIVSVEMLLLSARFFFMHFFSSISCFFSFLFFSFLFIYCLSFLDSFFVSLCIAFSLTHSLSLNLSLFFFVSLFPYFVMRCRWRKTGFFRLILILTSHLKIYSAYKLMYCAVV